MQRAQKRQCRWQCRVGGRQSQQGIRAICGQKLSFMQCKSASGAVALENGMLELPKQSRAVQLEEIFHERDHGDEEQIANIK